MAIGMYKPGQGYWVRVLTATFLGILVLATAAWLWGQASLAIDSLPRTVWEVTLRNVSGEPQRGETVQFLSAGTGAEAAIIGSARVISYDSTNELLRVRGVQLSGTTGEDVSRATRVTSLGAGAAFTAGVAGTPRSAPAVQPLYIQGGAAAVVLLLGAGLIYWVVGVKASTAEFLIATDMEMKKVNWSTAKHVRESTYVVIGASFLIAMVLFSFDIGFKTFFQAIGVLVK